MQAPKAVYSTSLLVSLNSEDAFLNLQKHSTGVGWLWLSIIRFSYRSALRHKAKKSKTFRTFTYILFTVLFAKQRVIVQFSRTNIRFAVTKMPRG